MLRSKSPQASFFGSYLYDRIVPEDHLLRKINQVVDFSFVREIVKDKYDPNMGKPAWDPEFMMKLCLLQYLYGDSDRRVVENARLNLAYKYFLGLSVDAEVPDDTTISYFRAKRLGEEDFRRVFEGIVQQCIDQGLVTGKRQIVDSTHVVADMAITSLTELVRLCRLNVLQSIAQHNRKTARKLGLNQTEMPRPDKYARKEEGLEQELERASALLDGVTHELKKGTLKVTKDLQTHLDLLEKAVADREEGSKDRLVSPVDPDARMGRKESRRWAGYKGHVLMEEDSEIITAIETTPGNTNDGSQLKPLLKHQKTAHALIPEELSADKAYDTGENLESLVSNGIIGTIALSRRGNNHHPELFSVEDFHYDADSDTLTCPGECTSQLRRRAVFRSQTQRKLGKVFQFRSHECNNCQLKSKCHQGDRGRAVYISYYHQLYEEMKERLQTKEGKIAYRNRLRIEHRVADLARWCGMRRSRYRGMGRVRIHMLLAAMVSNVKRMTQMLWHMPEPVPKLGEAV
ncbi:IS1182 family transposase [Chloroflexota bacterium]